VQVALWLAACAPGRCSVSLLLRLAPADFFSDRGELGLVVSVGWGRLAAARLLSHSLRLIKHGDVRVHILRGKLGPAKGTHVLLLDLFALLSGAAAPGGLYKILVVNVLTLACVAACGMFNVRLFIGIDFRAHQALISRLKVQRGGNISEACGELGRRRTLIVFLRRRLLHSGVSLR
jgi:hypothetical protein